MFIGISGGSSIFLFPVLAGFTGEYQTSNLGVGGSNPSERAKNINQLNPLGLGAICQTDANSLV
jgi:hypothetical protein